ncbi:hypothetical protein [Acaryochloris sp. CCMEE 5410]|uniref:hypothetical protein n=1 Tax=Acaryochloris sp. CCMEE 5410 TaxID=310037 RepID=UPI000248441D|nr:hypothetical protein [Acaryochloris sp. CCMEE 5410]KAI9132572.1 hypothetical protein ON05_003825 [Acaryochloris sp. CCMEE 5410]
MKLTLKAMGLSLFVIAPVLPFQPGVYAQPDSPASTGIFQQRQHAFPSLIAQNARQSEWDAFFRSQYTYWDALVLAQFWNQNVGEAKAYIGRKLLLGGTPQAFLEKNLIDARVQALASVNRLELYSQSNYSYRDAQTLAHFWGDSTPYEAKLRIERNLILGTEANVRKALRIAQGP